MGSRQRSARVPLSDRVYELLLVQFMNGMRPPGQRLNIEALSRELDISPTPVREALARLEHTGLVKREALRGYEVAHLLSRTEITKLMDTRLLLEPTLAAEATLHATPEFVERLAETIEEMDSAGEGADGLTLRRCWKADEAFHFLISEQSANPFMDKAYRSLGGHVQRFRLLGESGLTHARQAAGDHKLIRDAIISGDADQAFRTMRRHIENARARALDDRLAATGQDQDGAVAGPDPQAERDGPAPSPATRTG